MGKIANVLGLMALLAAGPAFAKAVTYELFTPGVV